MNTRAEDNRRIAKNTLILYFRMFLLMGVSLYTVRLLLMELGVIDYGIYNVTGGIIILFTFLNNAVTQSTQRYLAFYLGKRDQVALNEVFSMSINIFMCMMFVVVVLAETIGLWFLNSKLFFPPEKMTEVNITYQITIITFVAQFMQIPFRASIIAHEKMEFYAYLSIFEVFLKLGSVLVLMLFENNKLIVYAAALFVSTFTILNCYNFYCRKYFSECKYKKIWDKKWLKELTGFYGWNILEGVGQVSATQGFNMLFNIFCSLTVNAALAVCNQVLVAVNSFLTNFLVAFNPQIVKNYASGNREYFLELVFRCSKLGFGLMFVICIPVILYCKQYLNMWLDEVPTYTVEFVQIFMAFLLIDALSGPFWTSAQAIGRLKVYSIMMSVILLITLPVAYILLHSGVSPVWVVFIRLVQNIVTHTTRIFYLKNTISFPALKYCKKVLLPALLLSIVSLPIVLLLCDINIDGFFITVVITLLTVIVLCLLCYFILLDKKERGFINDKVLSFISKILKK